MTAQGIEVRKAENFLDYARCIQIRTKVFVFGQDVPPEREVDGHENECRHFLAMYDGVPVGTGRWRRYKDNKAKVERLAVLEEMRGKKIGAALMRAMMDDIAGEEGITGIILGAQDHAIPFYEAFGFSVYGDGYRDGGDIPHHDMMKKMTG